MLTKRSFFRYSLLIFLCVNLLLTLLAAFMLANGSGGHSLTITLNLFAYTAFLIITLVTVLHKKRLVLLTKLIIGALFVFLVVATGVLLSGSLQDLSGQQCSGLWGDVSSCVDNSWFIVVIIIGIILITFAPVLFFAAASVAQLRANSQPKMMTLQDLTRKTK